MVSSHILNQDVFRHSFHHPLNRLVINRTHCSCDILVLFAGRQITPFNPNLGARNCLLNRDHIFYHAGAGGSKARTRNRIPVGSERMYLERM